MEGNEAAFVESGSAGIQVGISEVNHLTGLAYNSFEMSLMLNFSTFNQQVLDTPGLLLFDTNWWEDSYQSLVALKIQDDAPISAAFAFQKGSGGTIQ